MRILLVQPGYELSPVGFRLAALPEPLALELLAGTVPDHDVEILDMRLEGGLQAALERLAPDVVATTALTTEVYAAQAILKQAKRHAPEIFTVVGGHHATLMPGDFFRPYVDAVCLGEGELVFPQLIQALVERRPLASVANLAWRDRDGGFVDNGRSPPCADMEKLPMPRRDLTRKWRQEYRWLFHRPDTCVATGRGCPYRCNFCSVWEFYGGRSCQMSPRRVLDEVAAVETDHLTFIDDNFLINVRRETEIAKMLKSEGIRHSYSMECRTDSIVRHPELIEQWVEIGLYSVLLGLEGASDRMLRDVNKRTSAKVNDEALRILKANGVIVWGAFIVHPEWTADDFLALRDYMARMEISFMQITVLTPLPGTRLFRDRESELLTRDYRSFDTLHAVVPTRLPREEFYRQFAAVWQRPSMKPYYDLVEQGKCTVEQLRFASRSIKPMYDWENFIPGDPVLGRRGADCFTRHGGV